MIDSIKRYVQEQNMFAEGDYVVAGVSGGADSICLLCVLLELRLEIPMTIHVVHINHKIREEAGEDAAYVEAFCRERQLLCDRIYGEVPGGRISERESLDHDQCCHSSPDTVL